MADYKALCAALLDEISHESPTTCLARVAIAESNMEDLRQASADVSGVEVLSPAAQAMLDAASDHWPGGSNHPSKRACIAAALRVAAEQVGPSETLPQGYAYSAPAEMWHYEFKLKARHQLLAIAAELDAPTLLERALKGDAAAAKQFLHEAGFTDRQGQWLPQYQPIADGTDD